MDLYRSGSARKAEVRTPRLDHSSFLPSRPLRILLLPPLLFAFPLPASPPGADGFLNLSQSQERPRYFFRVEWRPPALSPCPRKQTRPHHLLGPWGNGLSRCRLSR